MLGGSSSFSLSSACSVSKQLVLWLAWFRTATESPPEHCTPLNLIVKDKTLKCEKLPALSVAVFQITFSHQKQCVFIISQFLRMGNAGIGKLGSSGPELLMKSKLSARVPVIKLRSVSGPIHMELAQGIRPCPLDLSIGCS